MSKVLDHLVERLITERGLSAVAAARKGAPLYVYRRGGWHPAGARGLARAERLAQTNPAGLTVYGAESPTSSKPRSTRTKRPYSPATYAGYRPPIDYRITENAKGDSIVYGDGVQVSPAFAHQLDAVRWLVSYEKLSLEQQRAHISGMRR
jgi:hypothetical protein